MLEYIDIGFDKINLLQDLWEKNKTFHEDKSQFFKRKYTNISFMERMTSFQKTAKDHSKITVAKKNSIIIGYCISVINGDTGEIESLHVNETERGTGIGKTLMETHIDWMKKLGCKTIGVTVMVENEDTIKFYNKLGFRSNTMYMQLVE